MITVDGVKTYSNREALDELASLAAKVAKTKAIVEVGVFRGGSLKTIAQAARCPVYGIDTWGLEGAYASGSESPGKYGLKNMTIATAATHGLDNVHLVRSFSTDAARDYSGPPIGMLYVDGEHTHDAVIADFHAWHDHLAPKAVVCFDDYTPKPEHAGLVAGIDSLAEAGHVGPLRVVGGRLAVTRLV